MREIHEQVPTEQFKQLETFKELKQFIIDICFDYTCKDPGCSADIGLSAIRVLCKGKQTEEEFRKIWVKWRERVEIKWCECPRGPCDCNKEEKVLVLMGVKDKGNKQGEDV